MKVILSSISRRSIRTAAVLFWLILGVLSPPNLFSLDDFLFAAVPRVQAFKPGEVLRYDVSWSKILSAGTAVMEVKEETSSDGKPVFAFVLTGTSAGLVDKLYPVNDTVRSVFDPEMMESISFSMTENVGRRKRHRSMVFDHSQNTVVCRLNDDPPETVSVPVSIRDGLASLYYLRTKDEFIVGKVFTIDVHDNGKNYALEVHTLGREKICTPAGEFSTIKIKTRPLYDGVFQNKGEVFLWLTDDSRKIPVLMKSTIKIGSFVFTLNEIKSPAVDVTSRGAPLP